MRPSLLIISLLSSIPAWTFASTARADDTGSRQIQGEVIEAVGRWAGNGTRIVTDVTIRTSDVDRPLVTVSQFGGYADGYGMIEFPGPVILEAGMRATVTVHPASLVSSTIGGRARARDVLVVDTVDAVEDPAATDAFTSGGSRGDRFVRNRTKAGKELSWRSGCVQITYADEGTTDVPGDAEFAVMTASLQTWTDVSCAYISLVAQGREANAEVGKDRVNLIKFRDTSWCRPAVDDDPMRCHAKNAAAITTLAFVDNAKSDRNGEIVDADIEFNGVDFLISIDGKTSVNPCNADLANTLTHELGHVIGLDHTCLLPGQADRVDNDGQAVPTCNEAMAENDKRVTEATMYAAQDCGELKKQSLDTDDTAAACAIYPLDKDPGTCERPDDISGGCCSTSRDDGGWRGSLLLAMATGLVLAVRRRRTRRA